MTTSNMNIATSLRALLAEWIEQEEEMKVLAAKKPEYRSHFLGAETGMMRHRVELEVLMSHLGMQESQPSTLDGEAVTIDSANLVSDIVQATKQHIPMVNKCESPDQQLDSVLVTGHIFHEIRNNLPAYITQDSIDSFVFDARQISDTDNIYGQKLVAIVGEDKANESFNKQVQFYNECFR